MIAGRGNTITIGKFTILYSNVPTPAIHLVEIAFHSDMPATFRRVSSSIWLQQRCSRAQSAVEMGVEPSAAATHPPHAAKSHLRRVSKPCSCKRSC